MNLLENCLERSGIKPNKEDIFKNKNQSISNQLKPCENNVKYYRYLINSENIKNDSPLNLFTYEGEESENIENAEDVYSSTQFEERNDEPTKQIIVCSSEEELKKIHTKNALDPQYKCNLCGRKYSSQSALKIHQIRHRTKDELPFHCMFCPYKSATKRDLLRHHNQHIGHARQIYKCDFCPKLFKISSSLSAHVKTVHTQETTYQCGICKFCTTRRSTMRAHLKSHHKPQTEVICPVCEAPFKNKPNLKTHLMTHADAKPFACSICDKRFTQGNRLIAHQQAVHEPKNFECQVCQKFLQRFPFIDRLKRHWLTHTGEKPFKCCFCPRSSSTQGNILKHVRNVHQMFHFTFKDIQTMNGEKKDVKKDLTPEELQRLVETGKQVSESHLNKLKEDGLCSASLEQLQRERQFKKEAEAAMVNKLQEKRDRRNKKKQSPSKSPPAKKLRTKPEKRSKRTKTKSPKNRNESFDFSNCDYFMLPRLDDGTYAGHPCDDGADGLPTTTPIQVIWNANGVDDLQKHSAFQTTGNKKNAKSPSKKAKRGKGKSIVPYATSVDEHVKLSHSAGMNSPSNLLDEDHDLSFSDKSSMLNQLHDTHDFNTSHNNVLVTSLENLHNGDQLVDFDPGMESPNTVVIASEGIADFERMYYKNLDLYSQFLPIGEEDDSHFINPLESTNSNKETGKITAKPMVQSESPDAKDTKSKSGLPLHQTSCQQSPGRSCTDLESTLTQTNKIKEMSHTSDHVHNVPLVEIPSCFQEHFLSPITSKKIKFPKRKNRSNKSLLNKNSQSNLPCHNNLTTTAAATITTTTTATTQPIKGKKRVKPTAKRKKEFDEKQPEEIIMLPDYTSDETCGKSISDALSEKQSPSHFTREITIKNSLSNYRLFNDELDVMAIAEVEEHEKEVVLVIDSLSS